MKNYAEWHIAKTRLDSRDNRKLFQEREIWWCSLGLNIGDEENGKGEIYSRPMLIYRKFNKNIFLGIPLTTRIKNNPYYHKFEFKGREQCLLMSQLRLFDAKRLEEKMGRLSPSDYKLAEIALTGIVFKITQPS